MHDLLILSPLAGSKYQWCNGFIILSLWILYTCITILRVSQWCCSHFVMPYHDFLLLSVWILLWTIQEVSTNDDVVVLCSTMAFFSLNTIMNNTGGKNQLCCCHIVPYQWYGFLPSNYFCNTTVRKFILLC